MCRCRSIGLERVGRLARGVREIKGINCLALLILLIEYQSVRSSVGRRGGGNVCSRSRALSGSYLDLFSRSAATKGSDTSVNWSTTLQQIVYHRHNSMQADNCPSIISYAGHVHRCSFADWMVVYGMDFNNKKY